MIQAIISESGLDDAMRYWLLMELLCGEFKKNTTIFYFSTRQLQDALHIKFTKKLATFAQLLTNFSATFDQLSLNFCQLDKNFWKIETRIILDLMGKDFKRTRQSSGSDTPKKKEIRNKKEELRIKEKEKEKEKIRKPENLLPRQIFDAWNLTLDDLKSPLPRAKSLTPKRTTAIKSCLSEFSEMKNIEAWNNYFKTIHTQDFLIGQNNRGWKADFDFVINKNNLIKIVEGKYKSKINNLINSNPYRN